MKTKSAPAAIATGALVHSGTQTTPSAQSLLGLATLLEFDGQAAQHISLGDVFVV
jgi:hypothetical protein